MPQGVRQDNNEIKLDRQFGLLDSIMILVGIVIGAGIFLTTGVMASYIPSASLILLAWIVGGLLAMAGALTYAELGASLPEAGGQYVYLREAYGPLFGFLFGWISFAVYMPAAIALLAVAFAEYLSYFFPSLSTKNIIFSTGDIIPFFTFSVSWGQIVGIVVIIFLTTVNYIGVIFGKIIQNVFTLLKIGSLVAIIVLGFAIGKGTSIDFTLNPTGLSFSQLLIGFGMALMTATFAYDGWNNLNFVASEIKNPKRNLPLSLFSGTAILIILYVLTNYIYLYALPIQEMAGVVRIAEKSTSSLFGGATAALISVVVMISTFGSANGSVLVGPRIYYAMAKDKLFFKNMAEVHPRFRTPYLAIRIQGIWACILALSGTFNQLLTFLMFMAIFFYISAATAVFTLRKKRPDLPRPYKTWGYPVVPILFIVVSAGILLATLFERPVESFAGLGLTAVGIPIYFYWRRKGKLLLLSEN